MSISKIAAVLFDLDGTLLDTAPDLAAAANSIRVAKGLSPLPLEVLRPWASHGARGILRAAFPAIPEAGDNLKMREEFLSIYARGLFVHSTLFDGVEALLMHLEQTHIPWGIVTNKAERFTDPLIEEVGWASRAAIVVSGDTTPFSKPHPEPLLHAARSIDVPPSACLYVGDDERDIVAGKAAGMRTVVALYGYCAGTPPTSWGADAYINHPGELLQLMQPV